MRKNKITTRKPVKKFKAHTTDEYYEYEKGEITCIFSDPDIDLTKEDYEKLKLEDSIKLDEEMEAKFGNHFPVNVFPQRIIDLITDAEASNNFPLDFFATGILVATSGALRNKYKVKFKNTFIETSSLFAVLVGRPGVNKSHPLKIALKPIYDAEKLMLKETREQDNHKDKNKDMDRPEHSKRLIFNDATMEAVTSLLSSNPAGLTLHTDEFSGFLDGMDKYRKGDDQQKWMSIWSNITVTVDRATKQSIIIPSPFVSLVGTIQPELLTKFKENNRNNNGFIDRILFAYPTGLISKPWSSADINPDLLKYYNDIIIELINIPEQYTQDGELIPTVLNYAESAVELLIKWQTVNTKQINSYTEVHLIGMLNKMETYIHRFALITAVMDYACRNMELIKNNKLKHIPIQKKHVWHAIDLVRYFITCAKYVHARQPAPNPIDALEPNVKRWYDALTDNFYTQDALWLATKYDICKRNAQYYLTDTALFLKVARGEYEKKYYSVEVS